MSWHKSTSATAALLVIAVSACDAQSTRRSSATASGGATGQGITNAAASGSAGRGARQGDSASSNSAQRGNPAGAAQAPPTAAGKGGGSSGASAANTDTARAPGSASAANNDRPTNGAASAGSAGNPERSRAGASAAGSGGVAAQGCSAPNLLFCDDFEDNTTPGAPPPAPWTLANNGMGHSAIDSETPAHSGKASVKVTSEGGYQTFFALSGAPVFPHDGALYLRLYIRLDAPMSGGHNTYFKAGAGGASSSDHETRMGVMNGMLMINQPAGDRGFLSNEDYYRDGNMPGVVFAPLSWVCVETFFDPANKTIDVWVDGAEVPDLHRSDWEQDPIGALHFGFEKYAGPDATLWYDDIALSSQPIGCR